MIWAVPALFFLISVAGASLTSMCRSSLASVSSVTLLMARLEWFELAAG
jgi:hypothetical protein